MLVLPVLPLEDRANIDAPRMAIQALDHLIDHNRRLLRFKALKPPKTSKIFSAK